MNRILRTDDGLKNRSSASDPTRPRSMINETKIKREVNNLYSKTDFMTRINALFPSVDARLDERWKVFGKYLTVQASQPIFDVSRRCCCSLSECSRGYFELNDCSMALVATGPDDRRRRRRARYFAHKRFAKRTCPDIFSATFHCIRI